MLKFRLLPIFILSVFSLSCTGCDFLLRILQKEAAEEKDLFGNSYGYNSKVERLQVLLKELGYNPGSIDGEMGHRTRKAVKSFQKSCGLKVTGYVNKKTWETLNRAYEANSLPKETDLKQIQSALKKAGFDPGPIDGKMGPRTKKAIKEFQKSKGLVQNGKVGPKTWRELHKQK